ncbi:CBASS cGAMP-activated phospholipase [Candidatus Entotheonella palauensis]|uniref:CBASS cGAMP-activated phospholipase n=1 Tax=Candidatus Entotheonella palauensis TaxID=93172 RepID=UPI0015C47EE7|nr:CBASS cGAMP-activated phospholipase [Candidatus Entotheonella palauensis]
MKPELLRQCRNGLTKTQHLDLAKLHSPDELATQIVNQIARLPVQRRRTADTGRPFRILCLDGGGIRGVFTAAVLAYWEKVTQRRIFNHFDLIAGTSTGGILAIGLGLGMPAQELLNFYRERGPAIFPTEDKTDRVWQGLWHWFIPKFSPETLKNHLEEAYGKAPQGGGSLDNSLCRLVIPSYNAKADELIVFRTSHGQFAKRETIDVPTPVTTAMATAAAPTYFEPVATRGVVAPVEAIDGGVWANHPATVALDEAVHQLGIDIKRVEMLSIGTTYSPKILGQPIWLKGKLGWARRITGFLMKTQQQTTDEMCKKLLGNHYLRVDDASSARTLDDVRSIDQLAGQGESVAENYFHQVSTRFLNQTPVEPWRHGLWEAISARLEEPTRQEGDI